MAALWLGCGAWGRTFSKKCSHRISWLLNWILFNCLAFPKSLEETLVPREVQRCFGTQFLFSSVQLSSVSQSCLTLCSPMDCSMPGLPVYHQLLEFTQTHVRWAGDAIQPSRPLSSSSPPVFNLSQHQGLFPMSQRFARGASLLEFQLQHQSFQWTPRTDLL